MFSTISTIPTTTTTKFIYNIILIIMFVKSQIINKHSVQIVENSIYKKRKILKYFKNIKK